MNGKKYFDASISSCKFCISCKQSISCFRSLVEDKNLTKSETELSEIIVKKLIFLSTCGEKCNYFHNQTVLESAQKYLH